MLEGFDISALVLVFQILADFRKGFAVLLRSPVGILNNLDDLLDLSVFKSAHLLELPIVEEESLKVSVFHIFDLALAEESSLFEVPIIAFIIL